MKKYYDDKKYFDIVNDIIDHPEFIKLKKYVHHEGTRYNHCINVSYHSYRICKFLHLNYKNAARAGLLHDFFFVNNPTLDIKTRLRVLVKHPKIALINAKKYFELSKMEEDIIRSHMFPIGLKIPFYIESWIVNIVDDFAALFEKVHNVFKRIFKQSKN